MKKNPLSISTYMDSLRSSKLVEIRTDEPQRFLKKYNLTMDPFFFIYRMEPYEILEKEIIMNLIKVYAKETGLNFDD